MNISKIKIQPGSSLVEVAKKLKQEIHLVCGTSDKDVERSTAK